MKKLLLALSLIGVAVSAFGQGYVIVQNNTATALTNGNSVATGTRSPTSTRVGFYINANTNALAADAGCVRIYTTNLSAAGIFLGGTRTLTNDTGTASFPAGTAVAIQVRGWFSSTTFNSYEAAVSASPADLLAGVSRIMLINPTSPPNQPPTILVDGGFQSFLLTPVPEPSSIALGLLGLGAIALFRRRK